MAWIVKPSATTQIDRREAPYLTDEMKAHLSEHLLDRYPTKRAATLPVLREIQERYGWLPYQALEETAAFLETSAAEVLDTATFYEQFWLKPKGKYLIEICQSISCELMGNVDLVSMVSEKLDIEPGQTTDDDRFTLMTVECLGACGGAPCALVDDHLHENLTPEGLMKLLDELT